MANITTASVTDKVATVVLDDATGFVIGEHVYIFGVGNNHIDGTTSSTPSTSPRTPSRSQPADKTSPRSHPSAPKWSPS
jgi:hypothetical protein